MSTEYPAIRSFSGNYAFLSNFYECKILYNGLYYRSAEAAFQAQKTLDLELREKFAEKSPLNAKRLGRRVKLRSDWDAIRDAVMWTVLVQKFYQWLPLIEELVATEDGYLEEGNTWGDQYWGVCNGKGENRLGYMLMQIRNHWQGKPVQYDRKLLRSLACYKMEVL